MPTSRLAFRPQKDYPKTSQDIPDDTQMGKFHSLRFRNFKSAYKHNTYIFLTGL